MSDEQHRPAERRAWRTDEQWERLRERIAAEPSVTRRPRPHVPWRWVAAAAAAAVVAIAVGLAPTLRHRGPSEAVERVFRTTVGERLVVRLGDSSTITLGPMTTLRVASSAARRDVQLDGLGAFSVVHDAARPFVVHARGVRTTDVGTRFVVRAYAGDSAVRVSVNEGAVSVARDSSVATPVMLLAGDVADVDRFGVARIEPAASAAGDAVWTSGGLTFDDAPLADVARELERWFDVDIQIRDTALARRHVTAVYRDAHLAEVLGALAATLHFDFERAGRTVVIHAAPRASGAAR